MFGYGFLKGFNGSHEVPCRRVLETARAVVERDVERGVATDDPLVERLARARPNHSVP